MGGDGGQKKVRKSEKKHGRKPECRENEREGGWKEGR